MQALLLLPHLQISLHDGLKPVLELQWLRYAASADFRDSLQHVLHLSQEHHVKGWVTDDRLQGAVRPRDVEWAEQEILVPLSKIGLERFAQLECQDVLNRRTVDMAYTRTMPTLAFEVRRFDDLDQARSWAKGN